MAITSTSHHCRKAALTNHATPPIWGIRQEGCIPAKHCQHSSPSIHTAQAGRLAHPLSHSLAIQGYKTTAALASRYRTWEELHLFL